VSSVVDDIAKVGGITIVFSLPMILCYPSMGVIANQASVFTSRGCFFTSGTLHPIGQPISNGGLTLMVTSRRFFYDDMTHRFSPLLTQSDKWGVL
jgi:hypothetical protein